MRFKLDENLDISLVNLVKKNGHDAETVLSEGLSGRSDRDIYGACQRENRILVTLDMDFSNPFQFPPKGTSGIIVLRPPKTTQLFIRSLLEYVLNMIDAGGLDGKLWIVEPGQIRIHQAE